MSLTHASLSSTLPFAIVNYGGSTHVFGELPDPQLLQTAMSHLDNGRDGLRSIDTRTRWSFTVMNRDGITLVGGSPAGVAANKSKSRFMGRLIKRILEGRFSLNVGNLTPSQDSSISAAA